MESGNSSSMQSSSGGDEQEYESNFPTTTTNTNTNTNTNTSNMFMFSSNPQHQPYLHQQPFEESNFQNLIFWQQPQLGSVSGSSIPNPPPTAVTTTTTITTTTTTTAINPQQLPPPSGGSGNNKASTSGTQGSGSTNTINTKNPRKRTRASRRAPTTVLTTDTTNFRAMVQEFTGIPSSPFSASASPLLSRRLNDLFAPSPTTTLGLMGPTPSRPTIANTNTSNLDRLLSSTSSGYHHHQNANAMSLPSSVNYPFRPSAQKADPQMPVYLPKITSTATGSGSSLGLNTQDPGMNNPNPDLRYPSGGLFTTGASHFNEFLMGNEQQQQQQQHIMFSSNMIQHDAFSGIRLGSEPDPIGGSTPRSSTSTKDDQDGNNNITHTHTRD